MSYFTDNNFDSLLSPNSLAQRGNRAIIEKMKTDIKVFSESAHRENIAWRRYASEVARGLKQWSYDDPTRPKITAPSTTYMRHLFLAYGYLRFKPWEKIESKTVKARGGDVKVNGKWMYAYAPDPKVISALIEMYQNLTKAPEVQNASA
jgi:hypothetical protein